MILECSITILPEDEKKSALIKKMVIAELARQGKISSGKKLNPDEITLVLKKKSIDARKGKVKFHLRYAVYIGEKPDLSDDGKFCPKWRNVELDKDGKALHTVLIVGSGPAGLFAALKLLEKGIKPVILERGCTTSKRKIDIANISRTGKVDENSNYCFGEGGAGTFSDGKLFTRSNKRGNIDGILQIFVYFGADPKILTDSHPHIGSDKLPKIVNSMVETIRKFGGEVHFETKVTDLILSESKDNLSGGSDVARLNVRGVRYVSLSDDKASECELFADAVILATGHSATDVYELLSRIESERKTADLEAALSARILEEKTFAVGVRVEHPREVIDKIQYHGKDRGENLPAAEYRLVTQVEGRGVYSFCMCPGGNVVPSQSGDGQIVVNGMSSSSRNSAWSNAAIVVEVRPEDCASYGGSLAFRTWLEKETYAHGGSNLGAPITADSTAPESALTIDAADSTAPERPIEPASSSQCAPAQLLQDFLAGRESSEASLPKTSYTPGLVPSRLDLWLPEFIVTRLKQGFKDFDSKMHGFICPQSLLIATETRTSTPVRIVRDKETFESPVLHGLFPAGEGSGYSGGITSSAVDGQNVAEYLCKDWF